VQRDERHSVWVYDIDSNELSNTGVEMTQGFWIGQTQTRDGRKIYVATTNGELYEFDTLNERFKDLGYLLPKPSIDAGRKIKFMYGVTLSPDERRLYFVPAQLENPEGSGELYCYDIATGEIKFVQQLPVGVYTTADLRDDKHVYMAHFGSDADPWKGRARLMVITPDLAGLKP
jgi:outer membrane protein assembly factor BamB